jgi:hypothetical protein
MMRKCISTIFGFAHGAKFGLGRGRSRDPKIPKKGGFWACQKVVPPPCKNVQKRGFLGEKACIFGQFVHNFAQK